MFCLLLSFVNLFKVDLWSFNPENSKIAGLRLWLVPSFAYLLQDDLCASKFVNCYVHILIVAEFCKLHQGRFVFFKSQKMKNTGIRLWSDLSWVLQTYVNIVCVLQIL